MVRCGLPFIKFQSWVDHCIAGAKLQQPKAYLAIMPPHWAKACEGHVVLLRVGSVGMQRRLIHTSPWYYFMVNLYTRAPSEVSQCYKELVGQEVKVELTERWTPFSFLDECQLGPKPIRLTPKEAYQILVSLNNMEYTCFYC